jgi:hypothetical protein
VPYNGIYRFWDLGKKEKKDSFCEMKKDLMAKKCAISFVTTLVPIFTLRNSKMPLSCFCNCIKLVAEVKIMGGGLPDWFVVSCCSLSMLTSSSVCVLRGAKKFRVSKSTCDRIRGSHTLLLATAVFLGTAGCSTEGFHLRLLCSLNSSAGSSCSGWRESRISLWLAAYRRSMPLKSALPSRCLHSTVLSASAIVVVFPHRAVSVQAGRVLDKLPYCQ